MHAFACFFLLLQDPEQSDEVRIKWLVQELASDSFERREKATEELMGLGKQVLKDVNEALQKTKDPAARKSIEDLQQFLGAAEKVTLERLRSNRISFVTEDATLGPVMKDLMNRCKMPIELALDEVDIQIPNLSFKEATIEEVFNGIAKAVELQWKIKGDRKVVFFRSEGADVPGLVLEIYDVRAFTSPVRDHVIPLAEYRNPADGMGDPGPADPQNPFHGDDLAEMIRTSVAKESWDEVGRSLNCQNGILIVRNTAEVHLMIAKHLKKLRQELVTQVRTEILAVAHVPTFMAEELARAPRVLTEAQFDSIRNAAIEGKDAVLIGSLDMVGYKNQQVAGCHGSERILVTGYNEDSTPKTEVGYDGLRLMVRPLLSDNRQSVNLQVNGTLTKILSVEKVKTEHGDVQVPKMYRSPIRQSPTVETGKPVVLLQSGSLEGFGQGKTQLLIIVRSTPLPEK